MKKLKILQIMLLLVSLSSCNSCEEEEWTMLPPETQTGANTFGCYINGELFVSKKGPGQLGLPNPSAIYSRSGNTLEMSIFNKKNDRIHINIYDPKEQLSSLLLDVDYDPENNDFYYKAERKDERNRGKIYLTKFDTINKIASGIFSDIVLINSRKYVQDKDSVKITQGRFDIKLQIYNN
jgi:hypothetical protein